jgi:hypothetical protein
MSLGTTLTRTMSFALFIMNINIAFLVKEISDPPLTNKVSIFDFSSFFRTESFLASSWSEAFCVSNENAAVAAIEAANPHYAAL